MQLMFRTGSYRQTTACGRAGTERLQQKQKKPFEVFLFRVSLSVLNIRPFALLAKRTKTSLCCRMDGNGWLFTTGFWKKVKIYIANAKQLDRLVTHQMRVIRFARHCSAASQTCSTPIKQSESVRSKNKGGSIKQCQWASPPMRERQLAMPGKIEIIWHLGESCLQRARTQKITVESSQCKKVNFLDSWAYPNDSKFMDRHWSRLLIVPPNPMLSNVAILL